MPSDWSLPTASQSSSIVNTGVNPIHVRLQQFRELLPFDMPVAVGEVGTFGLRGVAGQVRGGESPCRSFAERVRRPSCIH